MGSNGSDPNSSTPNTTFVQADPSNFRAVVQRLTGATQDSSSVKLPVTGPGPAGPRRPAFKLHERRQSARKLEIMLNNGGSSFGGPAMGFGCGPHLSPSSPSSARKRSFLASPISPLEMLTRGSPRSPIMEEEERAIAEKGYYLHPSPLSTPRGSEPPELLPLFPLQSPTAATNDSSST
ncbi:VQ motif-containing protein 11 [Lycium barbarum]|uniref:VQ motif-containing protein 11 n=1 Tax=Lycium barbarum TaxID=112863 RepID=UPI00293E55EA|nr:VQ motif-containing protein 11 [Lycium barbarum]